MHVLIYLHFLKVSMNDDQLANKPTRKRQPAKPTRQRYKLRVLAFYYYLIIQF